MKAYDDITGRPRGMVCSLTLVLLLMAPAWPAAAQRLQPEDLTYLGAFRLPDPPPGAPDEAGWGYGGTAMTSYPHGDPGGPADGFPGSLFASGFEVTQYIAEISIPPPIISAMKNPEELNVATMLQPFHDVRAGLFEGLVEIPRVGVAYLPRQAGQLTDKLYFGWGAHFQEDPGYDRIPSHMWCDLDLAHPQTAGAWYIGDYSLYSTNDYLFAIPEPWAAAHTSGMRLATGRYRDGGWSGQGPSLFAYGPWLDGLPPPHGAHLAAVPLLLYGSTREGDPIPPTYTMDGYHHSDEWSGGVWLTAGNASAVIFVGTKGVGAQGAWYGNEQGPCLQCNNRGWWSETFIGQILFYDPADLAAVARGAMQPYEPQPYATLNIDPYLYYVYGAQQKYHVAAASFDPERGLLYVFETGRPGDPGRDHERSIMHVWQVTAGPTGLIDDEIPRTFALEQNYPNPFNPTTIIRFAVSEPGRIELRVFDLLGREVRTLIDGAFLHRGAHEVVFEAGTLGSGLYLYRLHAGSYVGQRIMTLVR